MVAPEVLKELQPYVNLADGLGRAAVQLVEDSGFDDVFITYHRWAGGWVGQGWMVLSVVVRYLSMVQGPAGVGSCRNAAPAVRTGIACPPAPCSTAHLPATLPSCSLLDCSPPRYPACLAAAPAATTWTPACCAPWW